MESRESMAAVNLDAKGRVISFVYHGQTYPAVDISQLARFIADVKVIDEHNLSNLSKLQEAGKSLDEIVASLKEQFLGADKVLEINKLIQDGIKAKDEELKGTLLYKRNVTKELQKFKDRDVICITINGSNFKFTHGGICYNGVVLSQGQLDPSNATGPKIFKWNGEIQAYSLERFGALFDKFDSRQIVDLFIMDKSKKSREFNIGRMKRFLDDELGCEFEDINVDEAQNTIFCNGEDLIEKLLV